MILKEFLKLSYYSAIKGKKKKEILSHVLQHDGYDDIMLSEVSQTKTNI